MVQTHVVQGSTVLSQWIIELMPSPISKKNYKKYLVCEWMNKERYSSPLSATFKVENQQGPTV